MSTTHSIDDGWERSEELQRRQYTNNHHADPGPSSARSRIPTVEDDDESLGDDTIPNISRGRPPQVVRPGRRNIEVEEATIYATRPPRTPPSPPDIHNRRFLRGHPPPQGATIYVTRPPRSPSPRPPRPPPAHHMPEQQRFRPPAPAIVLPRRRPSPPRSPSPVRPVRRVRPGFVQPAPLPPPNVEGAGAGSNDFIGLASNPHPKTDPDIQGKIVLCLYHNSKRSYDYGTVEYISTKGKTIKDRTLFRNMRYKYEYQLRGRFRRLFSFKGLTTVRLLLYGGGQLFRPKQDDDLFSLLFMKIWQNPNDPRVLRRDSVKWIDWIGGEKEQHGTMDLAIELIEDYIPERIVLFIGLGLLSIIACTSAWLIKGGDPGYVSTVMSFVLTLVAAIFALTTVWDYFDDGRSKELKDHAIVTLPDDFTDIPKGIHNNLGLFGQEKEVELASKGKEKEEVPGH